MEVMSPKRRPAMKERKLCGLSLSLILVNIAAVLERADENLLPPLYKELGEAFSVGPSALGYLTFIRNFMQGITSPLAGVLVINHDRSRVLALGIFSWAFSTAVVGISQQFVHVAVMRALNGFGLAIVIPAINSFIADSFMDGLRGAGFGFLFLVGSFGGIGGGAVATIMAGTEFWGIPGWRFACILMAALSSLIGFLVLIFVVDPEVAKSSHPRPGSDYLEENLLDEQRRAISTWMEYWTSIKAVMKVRTFQIIVLQGIIGTIPWTAMVFFTMWFELLGFDHENAAALLSLFTMGTAIGALLGGLIADRMAHIFPNWGRIMCGQFSAVMGIPFSWFLLRAIPQTVESKYVYAITLLFMGLTISWNVTATNNPIFAEIVPAKHRTAIYAFDRAFEGAMSSFAAPVVGILSENIYGFDATAESVHGSPKEALALSKGLLCTTAIPFALCSLCYTPLYKMFKQDRENARTESLKEEIGHGLA